MSELYVLPEGWEWSKLSKVCNLLNGYAFKAKEYVEQSNTVIIRMGNIRPNGKFDAEHKIKFLPNKYAKELPNYVLNEGDLIIAMTDLATEMRILGNPTLVSNLNGRTFMLNQRVGKLYDFNFNKIIIEYLRYIITAPQVKDYYKSLGGGGLQINIGKQQILSAKFPLPPLQEQKRIVAKLDTLFEKIDRVIALHQKNMDEADAFMGSVLNDVFGELEEKYKKIELQSITSKLGDGLHGTPKYDENGEYYFINGANVKDNKININHNTKKVNFEEYSKYKKELNDRTVFVSINGTIGNVGLYNNEKCILGKSACYFNLLDGIDKVYITYILMNRDFQKYIMDNATGATIKNVSLKTMRAYKVIFPPLKIQQKTVNYLDKISLHLKRVKVVQKEKMQNLKALKASILDRAFQGKL